MADKIKEGILDVNSSQISLCVCAVIVESCGGKLGTKDSVRHCIKNAKTEVDLFQRNDVLD